jgi:serine/threonine protein kinase/Tol biopolymer transport system component
MVTIGETVSHYRILEELGHGGMGVVYRARDEHLPRDVALKVLPPGMFADETARSRFRREAQTLSQLNHPNIATVYDFDRENGVDFLAMEFVEGETLAAKVTAGPLPEKEVVALGTQIAEALEDAHEHGIIHRDLKPGNVMVTSKGRAKVLDFGLAKLLRPTRVDGSTASLAESQIGAVIGTLPYMSPEQLQGKPVDARTDVYALGAVLYEMATARRPFPQEQTSPLIAAIVTETPRPPRQVNAQLSRGLEAIIQKAMERNPEQRYQTAKELVESLRRLSVQGLGVAARKPGPAVRRVGLALAVLAVALFSAWIVTHWRHASPPPQRTFTRLTFEAGLQSDPTFSPDGQFIAYASDRGGNFDIWVQQIGSGEPVQVTKSPAHDWQPDWSPDGKQIVFRSERDGGGLYVVPALGGYERKISTFGYRPHWSPDSSRVLFRSTVLRNVSEPLDVFDVGLDGNPPREVLMERQPASAQDTSIGWHPDGKRISYRLGQPSQGRRGFWTVPLGEGTPLKSELAEQVQEQLKTAAVSLGDFVWAPSGKALYFEGESRGVRNVWKVTVEPETLRWTAGPERLTTGPGQDTNLTISADGKKLAFVTRSESVRVWSLPFEAAAGRTTGEGVPVSAPGVFAYGADLTRAGGKIAFLGERAAKDELWVKDLAEGGETLLFADGMIRIAPRWSRDGTRLAYRRDDHARNLSQQVILPREGSAEEVVAAAGPVGGCSPPVYDWSLDGRSLLVGACWTPGSRVGLWLLPLSGAPHAETQMRLVTSNPGYNLWQGQYSPDGRWISFNAVSATGITGSAINVVAAAGGDWIPITDGKFHDDKARWSPDGKIIYFISSRGGFMNVWARRFDPNQGKAVGEPFQITRFESPSRMPSDYMGATEIGVAAHRLVLSVMDVTGSVWMLENVDK